MKLVDFLTIRLSGIFILVMLIWSAIYFVIQMREIHDGIDEGLNNLKQEFIYQANRSPDFVTDMKKHNPLNIHVEQTSEAEAQDFKEIYSTSMVYFVTEEEEEEVRMLTTAFYCVQDGQYYKLKFFTSTVERDDLVKNMLYLIISLWLGLSIAMIVVNKIIINKANKPFYQLLEKLHSFRLDKNQMISFAPSNIAEYKILNDSVKNLLEDNIKVFNEQKNFIENASHEMQTPLAVAMSKLELFMNNEKLSRYQLEEMNTILTSLARMKRLNSTLLLLSKIKNKQFTDNQDIDIVDIFKEVLNNFEDMIEHKELSLTVEGRENLLKVNMNKDLAYIMANNLMKNAVNYNIKGGNIKICFGTDSMTIANNGSPLAEGKDIFQRYVSSTSSGLGLSIVKTIIEVYNFDITYLYKGDMHIFTLIFPKIRN
ncbi:MAG: HAMP domain-containing sensor histidine kinase [Dysgonomonas sp.]|nr:HAMP domain-containing sensor histidine kinase [Dysgonomonas sp.]